MNIIDFNKHIIYLIAQYLKIQDQLAFYITCKKLFNISPFSGNTNNCFNYTHSYISIYYNDLENYKFTNLKFLKINDNHILKDDNLPKSIIGIKGNLIYTSKLPNLKIIINNTHNDIYPSKTKYNYVKTCNVLNINNPNIVLDTVICDHLIIKKYMSNIYIDSVKAYMGIIIEEGCKNICINNIWCDELNASGNSKYEIITKLITCNYFNIKISYCKINLYYDKIFNESYKKLEFKKSNIDFCNFYNFKFEESQFNKCNYRYN